MSLGELFLFHWSLMWSFVLVSGLFLCFTSSTLKMKTTIIFGLWWNGFSENPLCYGCNSAALGFVAPSKLRLNIKTLLVLIFTILVTSCSCEWTISTLRRVETYLRSTMGQKRQYAYVLLMNIHYGMDMDLDKFVKNFTKKYPREWYFQTSSPLTKTKNKWWVRNFFFSL